MRALSYVPELRLSPSDSIEQHILGPPERKTDWPSRHIAPILIDIIPSLTAGLQPVGPGTGCWTGPTALTGPVQGILLDRLVWSISPWTNRFNRLVLHKQVVSMVIG